MGDRRLVRCQASIGKNAVDNEYWRLYCMPVNVAGSSSPESEINPNDEESESKDSPEELLARQLRSDEVSALPLHLFLNFHFE